VKIFQLVLKQVKVSCASSCLHVGSEVRFLSYVDLHKERMPGKSFFVRNIHTECKDQLCRESRPKETAERPC
jgi:hypothetical protein